MTRAGVFAIAVLSAGALAPAARASFGPPVQLATGSFRVGVVADNDAAGTTTVLVSGHGQGPRLLERPAGGAWSVPAPLPGGPKGLAGPVLDAAGAGALGIAWRVDAPRRYGGIDVAMRDPGGTLGEPTEIAGDDAGGVRHPALAIDPQGEALLAYNTATKGSPQPARRDRRHLSQGRLVRAAGDRRLDALERAGRRHRTRRHRRRRVDA